MQNTPKTAFSTECPKAFWEQYRAKNKYLWKIALGKKKSKNKALFQIAWQLQGRSLL